MDRYVVERVLGSGGMADVYLARHKQLETLHAIKLLTCFGRNVDGRLLAEGRAQARLHHPNLVAVTDVIVHHGTLGLVLEYVPGVTLSALIRERRLTRDECDALATGILRGVAHAHLHGMVHRDLKPANILVSFDGQTRTAKVTDFGLVKLQERAEADPITVVGCTLGTPWYMAPEQHADPASVDARADVFSLGVVLYEMVTGQRCFDGSPAALFGRVSSGRFVPPRVFVPDLPDRMNEAILGALVVDREQRIQSVEDLLAIWRGDPDDEELTVERERVVSGADVAVRAALGLASAAIVLAAFGAWVAALPTDLGGAPRATTSLAVPLAAADPPPEPAPAPVETAPAPAVSAAAPPTVRAKVRKPPRPPAPPPAPSPGTWSEVGAPAPVAAVVPAADSWVRHGGGGALSLVSDDGKIWAVPGPVPPGRYVARHDDAPRGVVVVAPDVMATLACTADGCTLR